MNKLFDKTNRIHLFDLIIKCFATLLLLAPLTSFTGPSSIGFSEGWNAEGERINKQRLEYIKTIQEFLNQSASMGVPVTLNEANAYADDLTNGSLMYRGLVKNNW